MVRVFLFFCISIRISCSCVCRLSFRRRYVCWRSLFWFFVLWRFCLLIIIILVSLFAECFVVGVRSVVALSVGFVVLFSRVVVVLVRRGLVSLLLYF